MRWILISGLLIVLTVCGCRSENCSLLREHVDSLQIQVSLHPFSASQQDPAVGLRSVLVYSDKHLHVEGPYYGPEGPVSAAKRISEATMEEVVEELEGLGVWRSAERFYSTAVKGPQSGPPPGKEYRPRTPDGPVCTVQAVFRNGDYGSIFVRSIPWGDETVKLLKGLRRHIPRSIADELLKTCERFREPA